VPDSATATVPPGVPPTVSEACCAPVAGESGAKCAVTLQLPPFAASVAPAHVPPVPSAN
jgi:hypothetical protein